MIDPRIAGYHIDHGIGNLFDTVPPDPAKAYRCSVTVATSGDHECRVNRLTRDVYDRCGGELRYVGRSTGDTERDIGKWLRFITSTPFVRGGNYDHR